MLTEMLLSVPEHVANNHQFHENRSFKVTYVYTFRLPMYTT
jgi:hypothetical protein